MGIARHQDVCIGTALLHQYLEKTLCEQGDLLESVAHEEFEIDQHLVVARTSGVDLFTHITETTCQKQFDLRVDVFDALLNDQLAGLCLSMDATQLCEQHFEFVGLQKTDALKHGDMCHRAQHVVGSEEKIHFAIQSDGKTLNIFIDLNRFFPKFHSE